MLGGGAIGGTAGVSAICFCASAISAGAMAHSRQHRQLVVPERPPVLVAVKVQSQYAARAGL